MIEQRISRTAPLFSIELNEQRRYAAPVVQYKYSRKNHALLRRYQLIYALCVAFAVSLALGQVMLKAAADHIVRLYDGQSIWNLASWQLFAAVGLYAASMSLWIYILTRLPLTVAYPFTLAGSALVIVVAHYAFGETMTMKQIAGLALVFLGLIVANY